MSLLRPRLRVAAYVIRRAAAGPELLVFDHVDFPEAGTQVPAGGIEPGETVAEAAVREVAEETGLTGVGVVAELGVSDRPHPETGGARRTTYVQLRVTDGPVGGWAHRIAVDGEDDGLRFACRFAPLPLSARLADRQDEFLDRIQP
ncbi:NUDIX domain-containing protein [Micromonospora sp. DR5-3]|uniref:NUDIX hydrolase n=1 Tax=unclassified Micromonospora TaxID=2617518 RepID=UPI0011D5D63E|nr:MULTISPECIES: NUDIX domain-containing protein [unclassified Micromonospora]MCW3820045.1 NUDIX domain-containing protein [Micromonospora sp. DR5-3]TYC19933.1 NUDIX domain-containing protein [Micromonospora sp. MP36]